MTPPKKREKSFDTAIQTRHLNSSQIPATVTMSQAFVASKDDSNPSYDDTTNQLAAIALPNHLQIVTKVTE